MEADTDACTGRGLWVFRDRNLGVSRRRTRPPVRTPSRSNLARREPRCCKTNSIYRFFISLCCYVGVDMGAEEPWPVRPKGLKAEGGKWGGRGEKPPPAENPPLAASAPPGPDLAPRARARKRAKIPEKPLPGGPPQKGVVDVFS